MIMNTSPMDNRQLSFSHLLYLTAHHWRLAVNRRLKDLGMSQATWVAVASIARNEQPLSQSELAQELGVESATVVPLINRLVEAGLVERVLTERDKRKRLLVATPKGLELYHQVKAVADELREEILTVITPEEQEITQRVLTRLLHEVEKK
ncbi:MarR family transcriptional regulator [Klebsiella sp. STW0522-44]|nr:MarR family transcriptional regulator [Klebsiella sp. STW0522-44]